MTLQEIVQELRRVRKAQRLSCAAVGLAMGRSAHVSNPGSQISDWERGYKSPSAHAVTAWASALGLELTLRPKQDPESLPSGADQSQDPESGS